MSLRSTTLRLAPDAYELIHTGADVAGISVAQFIREAAVMRALLLIPTEPAGDEARASLLRLRDHVRASRLAHPS